MGIKNNGFLKMLLKTKHNNINWKGESIYLKIILKMKSRLESLEQTLKSAFLVTKSRTGITESQLNGIDVQNKKRFLRT